METRISPQFLGAAGANRPLLACLATFPEPLPLKDAMRSVQARTDQFELARSSLNVAIQTLEREGKLRRDGKKLFWIPTADLADQAEAKKRTEDAEAEDSDQERLQEAESPAYV